MDFLISVIVPVYNVERYLTKCVNSIINQTYRNLEIVLVNDGSTDSCRLICDDFSLKDSRIKVIHKLNGGLSSARNAALDVASGNFIGFVDADDFIAPDMYEKLFEACVVNNANIAVCGRYIFREGGDYVPKSVLPNIEIWSGKQALSNLLVYHKIDSSACDKLFSKELFINTRFPFGEICEDVSVIPLLISNSAVLVHIGEPKYYYFQRVGSISNSGFSLRRMDMLNAHKKVANFVKQKHPDLQERASCFYFHAFLVMYLDIYSTNAASKYPELEIELHKIARNSVGKILLNRFVPGRNKFLFFIIYFKIYKQYQKWKGVINKKFV